MTLLKPCPVSTRRFTYLADERMFVAEASDLPGFGRVYNDACDEGLTLVSHRTGCEIVCAVEHIERDREGDLLYWDLRPASSRNAPFSFTVRIFND